MALVGYSDSEGSDSDAAPAPKASASTKASKVEKLVPSSGPRRIKVDLPAAATEAPKTEDRPAKRPRTAGAFSGFNALLPAPKRTAENAKRGGLGSGISLKTSSAAAFSREPLEPVSLDDAPEGPKTDGVAEEGEGMKLPPPVEDLPKPAEEVKIVGNPMRFRPLSVANNKKKPKKPINPAAPQADSTSASKADLAPAAAPAPQPKVSLFGVPQSTATAAHHSAGDTYEPLIAREDQTMQGSTLASAADPRVSAPDPNSLDAVAADLNLSAADRRRLFGRAGRGDQPINMANFDMDREYRRNEELRAAGETVQHRAVRAVAPGKHSLQQLVNASSNQREALEDAWAEGKRNRGEAGNKYGWGK
ncbi:hypothetical protein ANO11243_083440 [Dothideomycetidae sp. 11243]|nr:hypothetical protein ANO11243_083440 [fungal sp. No.11243]